MKHMLSNNYNNHSSDGCCQNSVIGNVMNYYLVNKSEAYRIVNSNDNKERCNKCWKLFHYCECS